MLAKAIVYHSLIWLVMMPLLSGSRATQVGLRYYVSTTGDDGAAGTSVETAWRTLDRVNQQRFFAGDVILLQGGQTFDGNLVFDDQDRGSSELPITLGSFGAGRAAIRAGTGNGVLIINSGGFIVRDLIVSGQNQAANHASGITFLNTLLNQTKLTFVRIDNVETSGFGKAGIFVSGAPADNSQSGYEDVRITHCVTHDNLYYGIFVSGVWDNQTEAYANRNVVIADCKAYDNPGDPNFLQQHSGNGILLDNVEDGLIERCTAYNNGYANGSLGGGPVGIWAHSANRVTIQFCESFGNRTGGKSDGGGFDFDGGVTNSVMQYNFSHNNDGPGFMLWNYRHAPHRQRGNTVRYNLTVNDAKRGHYGSLHIGSDGEPVSESDVYHNTVINQASANEMSRAFWVGYYEDLHPSNNIRLRNNLFVTNGDTPLVEISPAQTNIILQGNAYWNTDGKFAALDSGRMFQRITDWRATTGREMLNGSSVGWWGDPLIISTGLFRYQLRMASPLIDRALDLRNRFGLEVGTRDLWGTPLPQGAGFDIGAHEWKRKGSMLPPAKPHP